ncbi:MAG: hypothetical protein AAGG80_04820 [Pseudomonadota bacterium]
MSDKNPRENESNFESLLQKFGQTSLTDHQGSGKSVSGQGANPYGFMPNPSSSQSSGKIPATSQSNPTSKLKKDKNTYMQMPSSSQSSGKIPATSQSNRPPNPKENDANYMQMPSSSGTGTNTSSQVGHQSPKPKENDANYMQMPSPSGTGANKKSQFNSNQLWQKTSRKESLYQELPRVKPGGRSNTTPTSPTIVGNSLFSEESDPSKGNRSMTMPTSEQELNDAKWLQLNDSEVKQPNTFISLSNSNAAGFDSAEAALKDYMFFYSGSKTYQPNLFLLNLLKRVGSLGNFTIKSNCNEMWGVFLANPYLFFRAVLTELNLNGKQLERDEPAFFAFTIVCLQCSLFTISFPRSFEPQEDKKSETKIYEDPFLKFRSLIGKVSEKVDMIDKKSNRKSSLKFPFSKTKPKDETRRDVLWRIREYLKLLSAVCEVKKIPSPEEEPPQPTKTSKNY